MYSGFASWLFSNGGRLVDFKTGEIFINDAKAVEALQFYADLVTKYKVVPPEAMTWEFDEIVAGGQSDRYAMVQTFAPYGTLINDPKISKTGGKWAWTTVPGPHREGRRPHLDRWPFPRRAEIHQEQGMVAGVHPRWRAASEWQKRAMDARQRAAARLGAARIPRWWRRSAGRRSPRRRSRPACRRRPSGVGHAGSAVAIGAVANPARPEDREAGAGRSRRRTGSAACGARGSADDRAPSSAAGVRRGRRAAARRAGAEQAGQAGVRRRQRAVALVPGRGSRAGIREADRHQGRFHPAADRCAERSAEGRTELRFEWHRRHPVDRHLCRLAGAAHGGSRKAAGQHSGKAPRLRLGRLPAVDPRHGELPGQASRHSVPRHREHPELPEAAAGGCRLQQGAGELGRVPEGAASPPPRQARRTATVWASGAGRGRRSSAGSRRSCAATADSISIRRPGRS